MKKCLFLVIFSLIGLIKIFGQNGRDSIETKKLIKTIFKDYKLRLFYKPENDDLINELEECKDTLVIKSLNNYDCKIDTFLIKKQLVDLIAKVKMVNNFTWTTDFFRMR